MRDTPLPPSTPDPDDPTREREAEGRVEGPENLETWRALDAEARPRPAPDPARVAAHLAGVGDVDLLADAAVDPAIRALLRDVVAADRALEAASARETGVATSEEGATWSAATRADLLAAFEAPERVADHRQRGPTALEVAARQASARALRRVGAAAALLLVLGGGLWAALRDPLGDLTLRVEDVERVGADGLVTAEGPRALRVGETLRALPGERVALRLPDGARVLLREGGAVTVEGERAPEHSTPTRSPGAGEPRALLRLAAGQAVLTHGESAASPAPDLLLPGGRLVLAQGAAHVVLPAAGRAHGGVGVGLSPDAVAAWRDGGGREEVLRGPVRRWWGGGPESTSAGRGPVAGEDALALSVLGAPEAFAELSWFGGAERPLVVDRFVGARRWRIADGGSSRRADDAGAPAIRLALRPERDVVLAWRPDEASLGAVRLAVLLRLDAAPLPLATRTEASTLRVGLEGVVEAEATLLLPPAGSADLVTVTLALPAGWGSSRPAGELRLRVGADVPRTVAFRGAAFVLPRDAQAEGVP